jgi:hypothetical protein
MAGRPAPGEGWLGGKGGGLVEAGAELEVELAHERAEIESKRAIATVIDGV